MRDPFRLALYLLTAFLIFSGSGCPEDTPDEDKPCAERKAWRGEVTSGYTFTEQIGNLRYFVWELGTLNDICVEEHTNLFYTIGGKQSTRPEGMNVIGKAMGGGYVQQKVLDWINGNFDGNDEVGLKQAFPTGPGYLRFQMHVSFPTHGDLPTDKTYLESVLTWPIVVADYPRQK